MKEFTVMFVKKKPLITSVLSLSLLCSCGDGSKLKSGYEGEYFNFDSLMSTQYEKLTKEVNLIERTIQQNGKLNNYKYVPDADQLADELNVLFEIDPNHPDYQGLFQKEKKQYRVGYAEMLTLKPDVNLPIKSIKITRFDDGTIDEIKGVIEVRVDSLNYTKKYIFLEFWKGRMDKFQVIEGKKINGDTVGYSSTGLFGFKN